MKTIFAEILLPLAVPNTFTYRIPQEMEDFVQVGMRVVVPFGKKKLYTGILTALHENPPTAYTAKYIDSLLDDGPIVTAEQISFWEWMAGYYLCTSGEVLLAALPIGLRLSSETKYVLNPAFDGDLTQFDDREIRLLEALGNKEVLSSNEASDILGIKNIQKILKKMLKAAAIYVVEDLKEGYKPKIESYLHLDAKCQEEEDLQKAFESLSRAAKQEEALLAFMKMSNHYGEEKQEVKRSVFQKKTGISASIVGELIKKEILELEEREVGRLPKAPDATIKKISLNPFQEKALDEIKSEFKSKDTVLLHGVTSSGKTEIYTHLIREALERGEQVLYMLPEIALTTQMIERLQRYFGDQVAVYHSKFNQHERVEIWNMVLEKKSDKGSLILGARSAVFLPFSNLGLIIVDEEHETSFKQFDPAPRYHARDSAIVLAAIHNAKTLIGSATPAYESIFNARSGKYGYVTLTERYGGMELPQMNTASLNKKNAPSGYFTRELLEEIGTSLKLEEQVILFQNRRGYAPILVCEMCGWSPECTRCDVTLTFHKAQHRLVCHYCGSKYNTPPTCPSCGSHKLKLAGFGTERIEEEIQIHFPDAKVGRLDFDSTRSKHAYQQILSDFQDGFIDILIGTQMVTKGLDFGKVNLVGILNADLLLKYPDFRATERGFQLMTQVSGRAGRRQKRGKVIIQSHDPDNWIIQEVLKGNFEGLAEKELIERRKYAYPPFTRMILLTFRHRQVEVVDFCASEYYKELITFVPETHVLGPEYPAVARVKNRFNKNIIIKVNRSENVAAVKRELHALNNRFFSQKVFQSVRLIINVDPQ